MFISTMAIYTALFFNLSFSYPPRADVVGGVENFYVHPASFGGGLEYLIEGVDLSDVVPQHAKQIDILDGKKAEFSVERNDNKLIIKGNPLENTVIKTPFLYYYGYQAVDENGRRYLCEQRDGRVAFIFPKGDNTITIRYKTTSLQNVSAGISILSIVIFGCYLVNSKLKIRNE